MIKITDSGNIFDTSNTTLYQGGQYEILLSAIQAVLGKYGYAVNVTRNNQNFASTYYYNTNPTAVLKTADGKGIASDSKSTHYFYVEVHKILNTKDQTFPQGSTEARNWQYEQNVASVFDEQFDHDVSTGYALKNIAAGTDTVFVVSLKDAQGNEVANDKIDADTPAGVYTITLGHYANGQKSMLVTNTATITITPKPEQPTDPQPTTPEQPTNNPTTPTQPTTPVTPPTNPVKSTKPSQTSNAKPKPVKPAKPSHPQGQKQGNGQNGHNIQPKGQGAQSSNEIRSQFQPEKAIGTSTQVRLLSEKNVRKGNLLSSTKTLPQTGAQQTNKWGLIGLIVAALAALVSLATDRKQD